jgi:hypothetical protein
MYMDGQTGKWKWHTSTGNDIVALAATDKERTGQLRFYSRILSAGEQALYGQPALAGITFETYLWLLWSVKESIYKYKKRTFPGLVFSPTKITLIRLHPPSGPFIGSSPPALSGSPRPLVSSGDLRWESAGSADQGFYKGIVVYGSGIFYSRSIIRDEIIVTVVSENENFEDTWWGFRSIGHPGYASQSLSVREFVVSKLNSVFSRENLQIGKSQDGYPVVLDGEDQMNIPVSLAHHDRFVAYSFCRSH